MPACAALAWHRQFVEDPRLAPQRKLELSSSGGKDNEDSGQIVVNSGRCGRVTRTFHDSLAATGAEQDSYRLKPLG